MEQILIKHKTIVPKLIHFWTMSKNSLTLVTGIKTQKLHYKNDFNCISQMKCIKMIANLRKYNKNGKTVKKPRKIWKY